MEFSCTSASDAYALRSLSPDLSVNTSAATSDQLPIDVATNLLSASPSSGAREPCLSVIMRLEGLVTNVPAFVKDTLLWVVLRGVDGRIKYIGELLHGKAHGKGRAYHAYSSTLRYKGTFENGVPHGSDITEYWPNGKPMYQGEFCRGRYHGQGSTFWEDGTRRYMGVFVNEELIEGAEFRRDGTQAYRGQFRGWLRYEVGVCYTADGTVVRVETPSPTRATHCDCAECTAVGLAPTLNSSPRTSDSPRTRPAEQSPQSDQSV